MSFEAPQALLLALPLLLLWWRLRPAGSSRWPRLAAALLLPLALARPTLRLAGDSLDLVVVVDRSRSMPAGSDGRAEELIGFLEHERAAGQRVGIVAFGRRARIERQASDKAIFSAFGSGLDAEASDLAGALQAAEQLIAPGRAGRLLVISDGLATGGDARAAARRLAARGIPVDYHFLGRRDSPDEVALVDLEAPSTLVAGEAFLLGARVRSTREREVEYAVRRDGKLLAHGKTRLAAGDQRLVFPDRLERPGLAEYRVELLGAGDPVPENDAARTLVRAARSPRVLLLRADGQPGALARSLSAAGLEVSVERPELGSLERLEGVTAVVLEDVPADALGEPGMRVLDLFVRERGGGLLMTGGPHSFGTGGYLRSRLEDLLPVSLELRKEQRRSRMAMVIAMDRSGSMSVPSADGRPKIALAAEGALAALTLLGEGDEAAVWVVDERAHAIVPLAPISEDLDLEKVASIESEGGGIFVYEALEAAGLQAETSELPVRHIVLFADASDSEEPGEYQQLLADLAAKRITVSVIGLGSPADVDAPLLADVARRGGGRIWFADSAEDLPRLFAQETIVVARASFVEEPTPLAPGGDLALLGPTQPELLAPPQVGGYNLTYLRPGAGVAYRTADDAKAPLLALWQRGLGRVATFAAETDGPRAAALAAWPGYRPLFSKLARWLVAPPDDGGVVVRTLRTGHELQVVAEVEPGAEPYAGDAAAALLPASGEGPIAREPLRADGEGRLVARFSLSSSGSAFPVVQLGGKAIAAPPVTLPYAPEYEPRSSAEGKELLADLSRLTGGRERLSMNEAFERVATLPGEQELSPWLAALALLALLVEVALRRLLADKGVSRKAKPRLAPERPGSPAQPPAEPAAEGSREAPAAALPVTPASETPGPVAGEPPSGIEAALSSAKRRASR